MHRSLIKFVSKQFGEVSKILSLQIMSRWEKDQLRKNVSEKILMSGMLTKEELQKARSFVFDGFCCWCWRRFRCAQRIVWKSFFVICTQVRICWCCLSIKDFWSEKRTCNFVSLFSKNRRWGNVFWSFYFNMRRCQKMRSLRRRTRWGACQTEKLKYSNFWISAMTAMCLIWIDAFCVLLDAKVQHYLVHRAVRFVMFALNPKLIKLLETNSSLGGPA